MSLLGVRRSKSVNTTNQNPRQLCQSVVNSLNSFVNAMGEPDGEKMRERSPTIRLRKCKSGLREHGKPVNQTEGVHRVESTPKKVQSKLNTSGKNHASEDKLNKKTNSEVAVRKIKTLSTIKVTDRGANQSQTLLKNESSTIANLKGCLRAEELRRVHCESVIEKLQTMILELHEKVDLALDVDKAKDQEILKYQEVWQETSNKVSKLFEENEQLYTDAFKYREVWQEASSKVSKLVEENKQLYTDALKFREVWQEALSKASKLDKENEQLQDDIDKTSKTFEKAKKLLHQYKQEAGKAKRTYQNTVDRIIELEHLNTDLNSRLQNKEEKFAGLAHRYMEEVERNKTLKEAALENKNKLNVCADSKIADPKFVVTKIRVVPLKK